MQINQSGLRALKEVRLRVYEKLQKKTTQNHEKLQKKKWGKFTKLRTTKKTHKQTRKN